MKMKFSIFKRGGKRKKGGKREKKKKICFKVFKYAVACRSATGRSVVFAVSSNGKT